MATLFNDSLIGSGNLGGRVSLSGHAWQTLVADSVLVLSAKGLYANSASSNRVGFVPSVIIPSGDFTITANILTSSAASAAWIVRVGSYQSAGISFEVAVRYLGGVYSIVEYTDGTAFNTLATFSGAAATVYKLTVQMVGANYTVLLNDAPVYGPAAPVNSPVGGTPYVSMFRSGTAESDYAYLQTIEYLGQAVVSEPTQGRALTKDLGTTVLSPAVEGTAGVPPTPAYCVTTSQTAYPLVVIEREDGSYAFLPGDSYTTTTTTCFPATVGIAPTPYIPPSTVVQLNQGWNAGARSTTELAGDGTLTFSAGGRVIGAVVGLHTGGLTFAFAEVTHGLYFRNGFVSVVESGTTRTGSLPYVTADVFRIERSDTTIRYYQNDTLIYTSEVPSYGTQYLESALYSGGDTVIDAALTADTLTVGHAEGEATLLPVASAGGDVAYSYGDAVLAPLTSGATGVIAAGGYATLATLGALGSDHDYAAGNAVMTPLSARAEAGTAPTFALGVAQLGYIGSAGHGMTAGNTISPSTSLGDSLAAWALHQWVGLTVYLTAGTGSGQSAVIADNSGQALLLNDAWPTNPDATSYYEIRDVFGNVVASGYVTPATSSMLPLDALGSDYVYAGGQATLKALTGFSTYVTQLEFYGFITAPMSTLQAYAHDSTGENAANITAPMPTLSIFMGMGVKVTAPKPTLSASATGTNWLTASITAPMGTLSAAGTVSGTSQANITAPMATLIGYGGMVCSVTLTGKATLDARVATGSIMNAAVTGPMATLDLFEVTTESFLSADIVAPMGKMGATLQAYILAPMATLSAIGTAVVTATYEAYAINLKHVPVRGQEPVDEMTRYTNFPFKAVVRYQNSYFGLGADGNLYLLEGTTDAGTAIPWSFKTGTTDFKSPQQKTVSSVYFGGRLGAATTVTLYSGEDAGTPYSHATPRGALAQNHRQKFGKGLKARYAALGAAGTDALELDNIELDVHTLTRRI